MDSVELDDFFIYLKYSRGHMLYLGIVISATCDILHCPVKFMLTMFLNFNDSRVVESGAPKEILIPTEGKELGTQLRENDISWRKFLALTDHLHRYFTCWT